MKARVALVCGLLVSPVSFASNQAPNPPRYLAADGILTHFRDAIWQVQLPADKKLQVDGKHVAGIRFVPDSLAEATCCWKYESKNVEISGQVDTRETDLLNHRIAVIALHSMTLGEQSPKLPAEVLFRFNAPGPDPKHAPGQPLYRFAYYLDLLDPPDGCERCYVPLLISPEPIELIARRNGSANVVWITTYERDSVWQTHGIALLSFAGIELSTHVLHFRGKSYRYELAASADVIHLLEHPMGTIPISRLALPMTDAPGADFRDLISGFHTIFRLRERQSGWPTLRFVKGKDTGDTRLKAAPERPSSTSELTVFDDGKVEYRIAPGCVSRFNPADISTSHVTGESWNWRETCPGSLSTERTFEYSLQPAEFAQLKELLDREEVKQIHECFCNAGPGVGDFDIEVARPDSIQKIPVVSFMPHHSELQEHPALTYLICEAKAISQQGSREPLPSWCSDLPPLK